MIVRSVRDPATGVLLAVNREDDTPTAIEQVEAPGFNLRPQEWRWDGTQWVPAPAALRDASDAQTFDGAALLRAVVVYLTTQINALRTQAGLTPLTLADVRQGILATYKTVAP